MSISPEWQEFLREQYPAGSQIKVRQTANEQRIAPGVTGKLERIDDDGAFHIRLKDGSEASLQIGVDRFSIQPPEPTTLKLYMPLYADFIAYNRWGDLDETADESGQLDGRALVQYEDKIVASLLRERMPEEAESGIMHWYGETDAVNEKVRSAVFDAEYRNGKLWGVAECRVVGELTPEELDTLKGFLTGQAADGVGESYEQHAIKVDGGELYVHLWNSDNWSIQTEQERFAPMLAEGLPDLCWSVLPGEGKLICLKRGESGYYPSDWETGDPARNRETADYANERRGITKAQEQAMLTGSMVGWNAPGADPKFYEQNGQQMGGMQFG